MIILITDPSRSDDDIARIARAAGAEIPRGKLAVMLRDKSRDDFGAVALATTLRKITSEQGHLLIMHRDHLRLAYEVGADGVHGPMPTRSAHLDKETPSVIMSTPAHSDNDVREAVRKNVDWALVSPVFETPEKGVPRGLDAIRSARKITGDRATPRIFALGGIDAKSAASCMHAGAQGVAVIRSILHAEDPAAAASALWSAVSSISTIDA